MHYRGDRFDLELPDGWEDRSLYLLLGPPAGTRRPALSVIVDRLSRARSAPAYAEQLLARIQEQTRGWEVVRQEAVDYADGIAGTLLEIARLPLEGARLFRRFYIRRQDGATLLISTQLDRKLRGLRGRTIDRIGRSLRAPENGAGQEDSLDGRATPPRPASGATAPGPAPGSWGSAAHEIFRAHLFDLELPADWTNQTEYRIVDPTPRAVQRNLVIQWEPPSEGAVAAEDWAQAEVSAMEEVVPGFRCLESGNIESPAGEEVTRVILERSAAPAGVVRQWIAFVAGHNRRYTLCLTGEAGGSAELDAEMDAILGSFATGPGVS